jgi:gliding motility-associated-like protein
LATSALIGDAYGVGFDNAGNMYIADVFHNVIRKVNSSGIISTLAGNGSLGYSGDGGPATSAKLYYPRNIIADNAGNIYFVDQYYSVIRMVNSLGVITTIAGKAGLKSCTGNGGPAVSATFSSIDGINIDKDGNIYVSDIGCAMVRRINKAGIVEVFAGNGTNGYSGDGGQAVAAELESPGKVAIDNYGNVFIPDTWNYRIRKVAPSGIITTFAGTGIMGYSGDGGSALSAQFYNISCLAFDKIGNLFVLDNSKCVVRKIDTSGKISTYAGNGTPGYSGDGGPAILAQLNAPDDICTDDNGNLYIASYAAIRKVAACLSPEIIQQPVKSTLCNSGTATFALTAANVTGYQWQVNSGSGWMDVIDNNSQNGSMTSSLTIVDATTGISKNQYRCLLKNTCGFNLSDSVTLTVNSPEPATITIEASSLSICPGTSVEFTAIATNGGSSPVYQWTKNGSNVGFNQPKYIDNNLADKDTVSCQIISNSSCITTSTAMSNTLVVSLKPTVSPTVSIDRSANDICFGTEVKFTAEVSNSGNSPKYQWTKNGTYVGNNMPIYADSYLNNGDVIKFELIPDNTVCSTTASAVSNELVMTIKPLLTPSITIKSSIDNVCSGTPISFTASSLNAGSSPMYQWKLYGENVGFNEASFTTTATEGSVVACQLTSSEACLSTSSVASNTIKVNVISNPIVQLDKNPTLCIGSTRKLDAGNFKSYEWSTGSKNRSISISMPGVYSVTVTDQNGCSGKDETSVSTLLPSPKDFLPDNMEICSYETKQLKTLEYYKSYLWNTNATSSSIVINKPGTYWLEVQDDNGCFGKDTISVRPKQCMEGFYIPSAFTPNEDGKNDFFRPLLFGVVQYYKFTVFNRWGEIVFQSMNPEKGWNGKTKGKDDATFTYLWTCSYQFLGEEKKFEKGSVVVIH